MKKISYIWLIGLLFLWLSVMTVYLLLRGLYGGNSVFIFWGLVGVLFVILAISVGYVIIANKINKLEKRLSIFIDGYGLSEREHKVLLLRTAGFTLDEISSLLDCGKTTIDRDIQKLRTKEIIQ